MGRRSAPMSIGDVFGRLTVLELIPGPPPMRPAVRARCVCGREIIARRATVARGHTKSCGCLMREINANAHRTHGQSKGHRSVGTPEYNVWTNIKTRVANSNYKDWAYYGGRGIGMAREWVNNFPAFLAHVGARPGPGYSIDRIDTNGDYAPGNVRWATAQEQRRNQRRMNSNPTQSA